MEENRFFPTIIASFIIRCILSILIQYFGHTIPESYHLILMYPKFPAIPSIIQKMRHSEFHRRKFVISVALRIDGRNHSGHY